MHDDNHHARCEAAWREVLDIQSKGLSSALRCAAVMVKRLARDSADDVAAIERTWQHIDDRLAGRVSEFDREAALVTLSVVFSALAYPDEPELVAAIESARVCALEIQEWIARECPWPKGFPGLKLHMPPLRANKTFPALLVLDITE